MSTRRETIDQKIRDQKWSDKMAVEKGNAATYHTCRQCRSIIRSTRVGSAFCQSCNTAHTNPPAIPVTETMYRTFVKQARPKHANWR